MAENSTENNSSLQCQPSEVSEYIEHIVTVAIAAANIPLHLFVLIAIVCHWNLVKRNVVNIYAGNVVLSSLVSSVWTAAISSRVVAQRNDMVAYREFQGKSDPWKMVVQAINLEIVLVTAGSIGLLINAMRSIQFRVHKTVGGVANTSTNRTCELREPCSKRARLQASHKKHPQRWAAFYMIMIWLLPAIIALFSTVFGSCIYECHCTDLHKPTNGRENCRAATNDCSDLLAPLNRGTLGAAVALYIVYIILLTLCLLKTKQDLQKITKRRCDSIRTLADEKTNEITAVDAETGTDNPDETTPVVKINDDNASEVGNEESQRKESEVRRSIAIRFNNGKACRKMSGSIFISSLKKNFKLLFIVFLVYVLGSMPLIVLALIDSIDDLGTTDLEESNDIALIIGMLPFLGHAICTMIITMYLSGIRSATRALLVRISRCCCK